MNIANVTFGALVCQHRQCEHANSHHIGLNLIIALDRG